MKPAVDLLALAPAQLHIDKLRCTRHNKQNARCLDDVVYDPKKRRGADKRTQLGKIKDGVWTYSPSYLKELKIEQLAQELQNKTQDQVYEKLAKPSAACAAQRLKSQTSLISDPGQPLKTSCRLDHAPGVICHARRLQRSHVDCRLPVTASL